MMNDAVEGLAAAHNACDQLTAPVGSGEFGHGFIVAREKCLAIIRDLISRAQPDPHKTEGACLSTERSTRAPSAGGRITLRAKDDARICSAMLRTERLPVAP